METIKAKRLWMALAAGVAALVMALTLVGCGPSDEEAIKKAVDSEMGVIVNPDEETISTLAEEASAGSAGALTTMGIDSTELVKSWIDGFAYEVGEITVDGDTATAAVNITCKQLGPVLTTWQTNFEANAQSKGFTTMDEIYAYAGQTIMEELNAAQPTTTEVSLELEKDGSNWVVSQGTANETALMNAMIGEY